MVFGTRKHRSFKWWVTIPRLLCNDWTPLWSGHRMMSCLHSPGIQWPIRREAGNCSHHQNFVPLNFDYCCGSRTSDWSCPQSPTRWGEEQDLSGRPAPTPDWRQHLLSWRWPACSHREKFLHAHQAFQDSALWLKHLTLSLQLLTWKSNTNKTSMPEIYQNVTGAAWIWRSNCARAHRKAGTGLLEGTLYSKEREPATRSPRVPRGAPPTTSYTPSTCRSVIWSAREVTAVSTHCAQQDARVNKVVLPPHFQLLKEVHCR